MTQGQEFVRHYRQLLELTGNDPASLRSAAAEKPDLRVSLKRIGELRLAVDRYRRTSQRRYVYQAHPDFGKALKDFDDRWRQPYDELRERICVESLARIAERFIYAYRALIHATTNAPSAIGDALEVHLALQPLMRELIKMQHAFDEHGLGRFIGTAPPEFREALADFRERWVATCRRACNFHPGAVEIDLS